MYMYAGFRTIANKLNHILEEECFHVKHYIFIILILEYYTIEFFIVHSQRKESGIHIYSKRVYAVT